MIVCDLGCCPHDGDVSIEPLIERFRPMTLWGFDPLAEPARYIVSDTLVRIVPKAAWIFNGSTKLGVGAAQLLDATIVPDKANRGEWGRALSVPCIDFARWLILRGPAVVKMNIEGAEFELLEHLIATSTDGLISHLIVQWHDGRMGEEWTARRQAIEATISVPIEEWVLPVSA